MTVCIPAYRAGGFIGETVKSVLAQTHDDLKLLVAIDPPAEGGADDTKDALEPWTSDPRLTVSSNPIRFGWAANTRALLERVETPLYAILPHDDVWAPNYLETLVAALDTDPDAAVAYADLCFFGNVELARKSVVLPAGEERSLHLLRFLLQGAEAMPWRGVTRTRTLAKTGGFPTDSHKGFAVESEYALALLAAGPLLHVPRALYFKRVHGAEFMNASTERVVTVSAEARKAGWAEHDRRMAALVEHAIATTGADRDRAALCGAASEAAMLARWQALVRSRLDERQVVRAEAAVEVARGSQDEMTRMVLAKLHLVLAQHWRAAGEGTKAAAHAEEAARLDPSCPNAALAVALGLAAAGRYDEAEAKAKEAVTLGDGADHRAATELLRQLYRRADGAAQGPTKT